VSSSPRTLFPERHFWGAVRTSTLATVFMENTTRDIKLLLEKNDRLESTVRSLISDRFWVSVRTVIDAFILDITPETHSSDDRMAVFIQDEAQKLQQLGVLPNQALCNAGRYINRNQ
jgi:hypothetical protein